MGDFHEEEYLGHSEGEIAAYNRCPPGNRVIFTRKSGTKSEGVYLWHYVENLHFRPNDQPSTKPERIRGRNGYSYYRRIYLKEDGSYKSIDKKGQWRPDSTFQHEVGGAVWLRPDISGASHLLPEVSVDEGEAPYDVYRRQVRALKIAVMGDDDNSGSSSSSSSVSSSSKDDEEESQVDEDPQETIKNDPGKFKGQLGLGSKESSKDEKPKDKSNGQNGTSPEDVPPTNGGEDGVHFKDTNQEESDESKDHEGAGSAPPNGIPLVPTPGSQKLPTLTLSGTQVGEVSHITNFPGLCSLLKYLGKKLTEVRKSRLAIPKSSPAYATIHESELRVSESWSKVYCRMNELNPKATAAALASFDGGADDVVADEESDEDFEPERKKPKTSEEDNGGKKKDKKKKKKKKKKSDKKVDESALLNEKNSPATSGARANRRFFFNKSIWDMRGQVSKSLKNIVQMESTRIQNRAVTWIKCDGHEYFAYHWIWASGPFILAAFLAFMDLIEDHLKTFSNEDARLDAAWNLYVYNMLWVHSWENGVHKIQKAPARLERKPGFGASMDVTVPGIFGPESLVRSKVRVDVLRGGRVYPNSEEGLQLLEEDRQQRLATLGNQDNP